MRERFAVSFGNLSVQSHLISLHFIPVSKQLSPFFHIVLTDKLLIGSFDNSPQKTLHHLKRGSFLRRYIAVVERLLFTIGGRSDQRRMKDLFFVAVRLILLSIFWDLALIFVGLSITL